MVFKIIKISHKFCLIGIIVFCAFHNHATSASGEPLIRVLISKSKNLRIRSDRSIPLIIKGEKFSNKKIKGLTLKKETNRTTIFFDKDKQKIYDLKNKAKLVVKSSDGRGIWVGQKRYLGILNLLVLDSEVLVINILGIEKYLSSVVGSEMPTEWPIEALKAQAIASRTYALKQKRNNFYDIDSTQLNQVYSGLEARNYKTIRAVRSTRSLVLTYKNKLINALFHSSSGGMTENSQDVWKSEYPYLSRVKDFDSNNPKLSWQKKFTHEKLEELFPKIGGLNKIEILSITETGRVKNLKIYGAYGSDTISGTDIRKKLNLKSSLVRFNFIEDSKPMPEKEKSIKLQSEKSSNKPITYTVKSGDNLLDIAIRHNADVDEIVTLNSIKDPTLIKINQRLLVPRKQDETISQIKKMLVVTGLGSGHGVGMSQWGARFMASKGIKAERILKHFYKGAKIKPFNKNYL